jgi:hypothetical protein
VGDSSALSLYREQEVTFIGSTLPGMESTFTAEYTVAFQKIVLGGSMAAKDMMM